MKTIAFNLQKGGTGKTTLAMQTAVNLTKYGKACIVDFDPQGNTTDHFTNKEFEYELADYFLDGDLTIHDLLVKNESFAGLELVPTAKIRGNLADIKAKITPALISDLLNDLERIGFKYCVFDTPPEMGNYINTILNCCNEVVTPILPERFSISGIKIFLSEILEKVRQTNPRIVFNKIIINNFDLTKSKHKFYLESLPEVFENFTCYKIPTSTKWEAAHDEHRPLFLPDEAKTQKGIEKTKDELLKLAENLK